MTEGQHGIKDDMNITTTHINISPQELTFPIPMRSYILNNSLAKLPSSRGRAHVVSMQFSPSGYYLAVGYDDGAVEIWNTRRIQQIQLLRVLEASKGGEVQALAWDPHNDSQLFIGGPNGTLHRHDVDRYMETGLNDDTRSAHLSSGFIHSLVVDREMERLIVVTGGSFGIINDVKAFDEQGDKVKIELDVDWPYTNYTGGPRSPIHEPNPCDVVIHDDLLYVVHAGTVGIRVFSLSKRRLLLRIPNTDVFAARTPFSGGKISPNARYAVMSCPGTPTLHWYCLESGELVAVTSVDAPTALHQWHSTMQMVFLDDETVLTGSNGDGILLWNRSIDHPIQAQYSGDVDGHIQYMAIQENEDHQIIYAYAQNPNAEAGLSATAIHFVQLSVVSSEEPVVPEDGCFVFHLMEEKDRASRPKTPNLRRAIMRMFDSPQTFERSLANLFGVRPYESDEKEPEILTQSAQVSPAHDHVQQPESSWAEPGGETHTPFGSPGYSRELPYFGILNIAQTESAPESPDGSATNLKATEDANDDPRSALRAIVTPSHTDVLGPEDNPFISLPTTTPPKAVGARESNMSAPSVNSVPSPNASSDIRFVSPMLPTPSQPTPESNTAAAVVAPALTQPSGISGSGSPKKMGLINLDVNTPLRDHHSVSAIFSTPSSTVTSPRRNLDDSQVVTSTPAHSSQAMANRNFSAPSSSVQSASPPTTPIALPWTASSNPTPALEDSVANPLIPQLFPSSHYLASIPGDSP
ncbi:hypothetical protein CVT24_010036, partial [Panaeolus cyanescens]